MGEVYLAKDSKLDRQVAIKVLPETMTRDVERVARFQREAKLLASLNHPNIAAIYGFEEQRLDSGVMHFIVMEHVEGETLSQRLGGGPFPVEDALDIAKQMAEALEAAHDKGVIHRDLKPGNVMVRLDGTVKVLDFGLAKAMAEESTGPVPADSPTITMNYSRPGVILGTAAYMSPEQARGRPLDKRTDIWSFGVMLYEFLTGACVFRGETVTDSMGAIMHKDPEWALLPKGTPPTIHLLLRRCLTKDRKRRLQAIGDARVELEAAIVDPTSTSLGLAQTALEVKRRLLPSWPINLAFVAILAMTATATWFAKPKPKDTSQVIRLTAMIPDEQEFTTQAKIGAARMPLTAISPDGTTLAYLATTDSKTQIYVRHMNQQEAVAMTYTADADSPIFSSDGRWIAFSQDGRLKKISVLGGPAQTICDAPQLRGAHWGANNRIAFAPTRRSGIWIVSADGGKPDQVTDLGPDPGAASHRWPQLLPDGRSIVFSQTDNEDDFTSAKIEAVSVDTGKRKVLIEGAMYARYLPTGHLVFVRGDVLMAVEFDPIRVEIMGSEIPVLEDLKTESAMGTGQYSFSDNGVLVYMSGNDTAGVSELVWVDRAGKTTPVSQHARNAIEFSLSPDGSRIAWVLRGGVGSIPDIWVLNVERDMLTRLTFDDGSDMSPIWSPDGTWIYFNSDRVHGVAEIYRRKADGSGNAERLTNAENAQNPLAASPDGHTILFYESLQSGGEIMLLNLDEERTVEPFLTTPFAEDYASISPDGSLIAYTSNETGEFEVYVRQFPSGTGRVKISPGLGRLPKWSPDGTELFYANNDSEYYSVTIEMKDNAVIPSTPKLMFKLPVNEYSKTFNVAPDGQRFLFERTTDAVGDQNDHPIVVVNWFRELREKMSTVKDR